MSFVGDWRLSLNANTMECLLRISVEGIPVEEFNPLPVVTQWRFSGCKMRRPQLVPYGQRPKKDSSFGDHDNEGNSDSDETDRDDEKEEDAVDEVKDELILDELQ